MVLTLIGLAAVLLAFFSSRYRKPALVTAGGIFVGGHLWYFVIPVDEIKYWVFDKYCESASETVFFSSIRRPYRNRVQTLVGSNRGQILSQQAHARASSAAK